MVGVDHLNSNYFHLNSPYHPTRDHQGKHLRLHHLNLQQITYRIHNDSWHQQKMVVIDQVVQSMDNEHFGCRLQGRRNVFKSGGAKIILAHAHFVQSTYAGMQSMPNLGGLGHAPQKILKIYTL